MGNIIAQAVLLGWPLVTLVLFLTLSTQRAIVASLVGAFLMGPFGLVYNFPGVPPLDKTSIPNIATFLLAMVLAPSGQFRWIRSLPVNLLLLAYVFGPFATGFTNPDTVQIGTVMLPGLSFYDSISAAVGRAMELMPFILGAGFMGSERAHRDILLVFVVAALAYTAPILMEVIKGPFLQAKVYGLDPGVFYQQQMRSGGGFRAPVFMGHGLLVSFFIGMSVLAAVGLWRSRLRLWGASAVIWACVLFVVLILNKSAGALISVILIAPLLPLLSARRFLTLTLAVGLILVTYPTLRAAGFIPTDTVKNIAGSFSQDRASSLEFRLRNEDILLDRANQRPMFGWGGYLRNRVFVVTDWGATRDITVTDGTWIIILGTSGWLGYLALFGLLCYPFWHLFKRRRMGISPATQALVAMLLFNVLDLIPNSSLLPVTWLIAGALAGFSAVKPSLQRPRHLVGAVGAQPERAAAPA